jgi:hypothetical protein
MRIATIAVAAALLAGPATADGAEQAAPQPPPSADRQGSESEKTKGYGYGTPPGREAGGSAGQAVEKKGKKKVKAPQQEEDAPAKERTAPNAAAPQGSQQQGSYEQGGTAPAR